MKANYRPGTEVRGAKHFAADTISGFVSSTTTEGVKLFRSVREVTADDN